MGGVEVDDPGAGDHVGQLALAGWPNQAVLSTDDDGGGHVDARGEDSGVERAQGPAGGGDGGRIAPSHLGLEPAEKGLELGGLGHRLTQI
ncbi:MAG: hypothetical protein ACRDLA_18270, partial [Thermoleophilaceae bacterium]